VVVEDSSRVGVLPWYHSKVIPFCTFRDFMHFDWRLCSSAGSAQDRAITCQ
jgi:hypothetical protein